VSHLNSNNTRGIGIRYTKLHVAKLGAVWGNYSAAFKLSKSSADLTLVLTTKSLVTNNPHFHCTNMRLPLHKFI